MTYSHRQLAEAFLQTGEFDDALDALNHHLYEQPSDVEARRLRAAILLRLDGQHHLETALDDLSAFGDQTTVDDLLYIATIYERMGDAVHALTILQNAHHDHPDQPRLTERLLMSLRSHGLLDQAYELALTQPNDDWRWQGWAGEIALESGDYDSAIRHFSTALQQLESKATFDMTPPAHNANDMLQMAYYGNYAQLLLARGDASQQNGNLSQAAADFTKAAIILPDDPVIPLKQGIIAWEQSDYESAVAFCRRGFEVASPAMLEYLLAHLDEVPDLRQKLESAGFIP